MAHNVSGERLAENIVLALELIDADTNASLTGVEGLSPTQSYWKGYAAALLDIQRGTMDERG